MRVEIGLESEGLDGDGVKGHATVVVLDVMLGGIFAGEVGLESGREDSEVSWEF